MRASRRETFLARQRWEKKIDETTRSRGTFVGRSGWKGKKKSFEVESDRLGANCTRINEI